MVVNWDEQERVRQLLTEAITVLCKNGLKYSSKFCVEGLLGITLDDNDILLVNIKETIASGNGSSAGISVSPMQSRPPSLSNRSPMGMGQRMTLTSPRRGRAKPIMSTRGRGGLGLNRKRNLFSTPPKTTQPQMRQIGSPSQQLAMPLPDQSGLTEGPPSKVKREEESAPDDVIEIGDDDDSTAHTTQPDPTTSIKHETPDQPSSSTDPQQQETKFTLDSETNKSLTDFLDNLMTQHDVGPGSSSSSSNTPARGGTPLSQMSQMTPKAEPINMPWEQPQAPIGYSSPGQQGGAPAFHSPTHQSQETSGDNEPGVVDVRPMVSIMDAGSLRIPNLQRGFKSPKAQKISKTKPNIDSNVTNNINVTSFTTYVCQMCKSTFGTQSGLRNHQAQHYSNQDSGFFCENCNIRFNSQASLYRHKRLVHSPDGRKYIHNCEYCHKGYFNKTDLLEHMYNHTRVPGFACDQCDERFRSKVMLRKHRRDHHIGRLLQKAQVDK